MRDFEKPGGQKEVFVSEVGRDRGFRYGTILVNCLKCGRRDFVCAKPKHPSHSSQYLWNTTINGKSYVKNLKLDP